MISDTALDAMDAMDGKYALPFAIFHQSNIFNSVFGIRRVYTDGIVRWDT